MSFSGTLIERMGIELLESTPERVVGTMPVEGNTQPYGLLHGGASCVLAETLGSVGAAQLATRFPSGMAVGVELNATHHKAVLSGAVTGVAALLSSESGIASYEIVISDMNNDRVCTARLMAAIHHA
ncbi:hotdog fold thioesterase [Nocardiopsis rhodophaea]